MGLQPYYTEPGMTIYHGDCTEVLSTFAEQSIALTVTSPPYDAMRTYGGYTWDFPTTASRRAMPMVLTLTACSNSIGSSSE